MVKHKVQIVDVRDETEHDVEFGTCDVCMGTGSLTRFWFTFEVGSKRVEMENGRWDYGDYEDYFRFYNVIRFINEFNMQNIMVDDISDITPSWMENIGGTI